MTPFLHAVQLQLLYPLVFPTLWPPRNLSSRAEMYFCLHMGCQNQLQQDFLCTAAARCPDQQQPQKGELSPHPLSLKAGIFSSRLIFLEPQTRFWGVVSSAVAAFAFFFLFVSPHLEILILGLRPAPATKLVGARVALTDAL